jgi:acetyltransferase-like isoleucine patch superfamily enzyme
LYKFFQLDTPWKILNQAKRMILLPLIRLQFMLSGISWGENWRIYGVPVIQKHRRSTVQIGKGLDLRSTIQSNPLAPNRPVVISTRKPGAVLIIGDHFGMTGGSIVVDKHVKIGNNVAVGANTIICDTDFHPLQSIKRFQDPNKGAAAPIIIEDNVFIGMQCLILKGVTIGEGSVIGAGSVVTKNVPSRVIVAGNPARIIREL